MIGTEFGFVYCDLKSIMIKKHISIYKLSKLTGLKYEVIVRYYSNNITKYDSYVLAKLCFVLECSINDLLKYEV
jgi:putative transcriptional regulator